MKKIEERLSEETLRILQELQGLYFPADDSTTYVRKEIFPLEGPLTTANFGIIINKVVYEANDFRWFSEDGRDRDFRYGNEDDYFTAEDLPDEVFCLLNTVICIKFATRHLANAKAMLDAIDDTDAKQSIAEAIADFDKASDSNEKLQIASDALSAASEIFSDIDDDLYDEFYNASNVIEEVLEELAKRS